MDLNLDQMFDIFNIVSEASSSLGACVKGSKQNRANYLSGLVDNNSGIIKVAFDTRRIDQETEYNPRRGLQNFHRSEEFISQAISQKLKNFSKLRNVLVALKEKYGKEPEWQDSYSRVLLSTLDKGLRTNEKDGDYTDSQPAMGSFDYIEELLYVRYRLTFDQLTKLSEEELMKVILSRDEDLTKKDINKAEISRHDVATQGYDTLLEKLFGGIKATKENPNVERTVTITVKDRFVEEKD
jgi:hypothetical protein